MLLDEPTSGLVPRASNEFSELLKKFSGRGCAGLMATRGFSRAKEPGTCVAIMKHGRLLTEMTTDEIGHADLERVTTPNNVPFEVRSFRDALNPNPLYRTGAARSVQLAVKLSF